MKSTFLILLLLLVSSVSFLGCKKDDPDADNLTSDATNFTYTLEDNGGALITVNNPVKSASYTIDFGDGTSTSMDDDISDFKVDGKDQYTRKYYYKTNGSYTITVSAKETNNGSASSPQTVAISGVPTTAKIKYFKLKDYPTLNPANNGDWDADASGPDISYSYYISNTAQSFDISNIYLNASKSILPLQLNIDTLSFNLNIGSVSFSCYDNDSPSPNQGITSLNFVIQENTTQGVTYSNGDKNSVMYPTTLSNSYLEIGIDWLP